MKKMIFVGLFSLASIATSAVAVADGRIPQSFPGNQHALDKMPSQAYGRLPSFPPSRSMGTAPIPQVQGMPGMMPDASTQGTARIPGGYGLDGFNNRGSRRP